MSVDNPLLNAAHPNHNKPYNEYTCQGRYNEPGTPWDSASLCSAQCDLRFECWAIKNNKPIPPQPKKAQ